MAAKGFRDQFLSYWGFGPLAHGRGIVIERD
jgi:hypothetical protein